jgi:predicted  nucleic acid-binding Zn-ribbon protein
MEESSDEGVGLAVLQSVRCLECGAVYAKPTRGGTATVNPGCPECGYVGWVSAAVPMRFASDEQRPENRRTGSG